MGFMFLMVVRFRSEHPDLFALTSCLKRLENMQRMQRERMGEEVLREKKALEIFVATRYPKVLSDPSLQSNPATVIRPLWTAIDRNVARSKSWRALAERLMAAHPNPTEEEIRQSAAVLEPFLRNRQNELQVLSNVFERLLFLSFCSPGWFSVCCLLCFSGGAWCYAGLASPL